MPQAHWRAKDVLTVTDFLTPKESAGYIGRSEGEGYEEATVSTEQGMVMIKSLRNNDRVISDDPALAEFLWSRLRGFMPPKFKKKWRPIGLNERFRFYRYSPGQQFDWHQDGYFERENGERSFFTFMIYLNDAFAGGETSFAPRRASDHLETPFLVRPRTGMALLFHHPIPHKGETVVEGQKYVLRTDVMYARRSAADEAPEEDEEDEE